MELLVKINKKDNIKKYINNCDGFIIGLKDFSVDYEECFTKEEINSLSEEYNNKSIFVAINKNIFNKELKTLEETLLYLDNSNIKGILFYDMSILYLKNKNNLKKDLVWNQTHMVTNYNTCNYYFDNGVKYSFISGELIKDEILDINDKSKTLCMTLVLGHQVMSHSKRKLLTNYYTSINKKYDGKLKEIYDKDNKYLILEKDNGTVIKTNTILNAIPYVKEFIDRKVPYLVVDESLIDSNLIVSALNIINDINNNKDININIEKSIEMFSDNTSFLFKKTIYKVKGDK